jgi:hypothetical protein
MYINSQTHPRFRPLSIVNHQDPFSAHSVCGGWRWQEMGREMLCVSIKKL